MNATPKGNIQNPKSGAKPNTPPTINTKPTTERTPIGTWVSPQRRMP